MEITKDIKYIGVNDHNIDLFEGQYVVKNGMAYNSYVILDEKIAVMDTVDIHFTHEWLDNLSKELNGKNPDYLIIQHMEPDHSGNIEKFIQNYPNTKVVGNIKTFNILENFFPKLKISEENKLVINNGDNLNLGKHNLKFVFAPMVHWPEVFVTFDEYDKVLFSADGFGKFGANDIKEDWDNEARRYYIGIVGKYGLQVQNLLKVANTLPIAIICPLHGPVLKDNLAHYINLYNLWSSYTVEEEGILIAYTSVYGNTKKCVNLLEEKLKEKGAPKVVVLDLARTDMAFCVSEAFRYSKIIFATTTYNASIYPFMYTFIHNLVERGFKNRTVGFIENGSWAPMAYKVMKEMLDQCKMLNYLETRVTIKSAMNDTNLEEIEKMSDELCHDYVAMNNNKANKNDLSALFKIGYGLYVITTNDGKKDNGMIVNSVQQVTSKPNRIAVTINKDNYTHHIIMQTRKLNLNCLSVDAPFSVFEKFGFQSGRITDKFKDFDVLRSDNNLVFLPKYINSFMSLDVEQYIDLGTHGMFICSISEARVINDNQSMTYAYYFSNVKPKPEVKKKGWVCKICGYVYEGDELPEDIVCPLCKHGASDFEPLK